jgi:hypothetical protein
MMRVTASGMVGACVAVVLGAGLVPAAGAGGGLPQGAEPVALDPAQFATRIDNPYWPMRPGTRWVYRETESDGTRRRVVVTVTGRTEMTAAGVRARVVRDTVTEGGALVEDTRDLYAQDRSGAVWYLGERTAEYEDGRVVSTAGSWEAGVAGAQAGVVMPARPRPGQRYRQEYLAGQAEDRASIVAVGEQAQTPAGHFRDVVMTRDENPLEPRVLEFKFYARGVGPVLALDVSGGAGREELLRVGPVR